MPKRKFLRISSSILIDLYERGSVVPKGRGCIVDISLGGLAVETEASIAIGDELFVRIFLHEKEGKEFEPIEMYATVMRFQQVGNLYHYGLKYSRMGIIRKFKIRKSLHRLIDELQPAGSPSG
ncbi:MAG: PilZ domain-containing protein [Elusimicrobiota bacterium]